MTPPGMMVTGMTPFVDLAPVAADVQHTVISGPWLIAGLLALAAGIVSFASPCVVPLVPGYLSYLAGLVGADTARPAAVPASDEAVAPSSAVTSSVAAPVRARRRAIGATALFVLGFSVVFLAESALVLGIYTTLIANQALLMRISGVVAIVMGLVLLVPLWQREWRPMRLPGRAGPDDDAVRREAPRGSRRAGRRGRLWGAPVLGAAFGTGWLACTSPTLAGILALSTATEWNGNALRGLSLVVLYCAGLGIPFLLLAIGFGWVTTVLGALRRHARGIQVGGAAVLVLIGVLMLTGVWGVVLAPLQGAALLL